MASLLGKALRAQVPVPVAGSGRDGVPSLMTMASGRGNRDSAFLQAYKQQGTVHANAALLALGTAGPVWQLFQVVQDGRQRYSTSDQGSDQRKEVIRHAALALLNAPGTITLRGGRKRTILSRFRLFELSQLHMELTGKSHWVVDRAAGIPVGLWPVRPDRMMPVPDRDLVVKGWVYTSPDGREQVPLDPDDVIFNCFPDPEDILGGAGWVEPVLTEVTGARYAAEWNSNFFANSARPDGVIQVPGNWSDQEFDEFSDRWRETHRGTSRAHRVAILEGGATWQATSTTPKDMDFANLLSTGADRIREASAMHKIMTGVTEDVNRANAQTGEEVFAAWQIAPRLQRWRDVLNTQYLPMFGATGQNVEFDFVYPTPINREQDNLELTAKAGAVTALVNAGYDQADVLKAVGLPPMKVDETATQMPAVPPGWVLPPPAAPGGSSSGGDDSDDGEEAAVARARQLLGKKDANAKVLQQLAEDYPPAAMAWAHHATWTGPVSLPASHFTPDMKWMDLADPHHVSDFVAKIRAGKQLKPVIAVKTPGSDKPGLVDGHHRYLACQAEGVPVRAWIGTVTADHGPWETMHDKQLDGRAAAARRAAIWNSAGVRA